MHEWQISSYLRDTTLGNMNKKIKPWPTASFALKIKFEPGISARELVVYLERRLPGKFGRLEIMRAIVKQDGSRGIENMFKTANYKKRCLELCYEKIMQAGVTEPLLGKFMKMIYAKYPMPSEKELFTEQINNPIYKKMLGPTWKKLSFHKTGEPKFTVEDIMLIKNAFKVFKEKASSDTGFLLKYAKMILPNKQTEISNILNNSSKSKRKHK